MPGTRSCGRASASVLPAAASDTMREPGATRSGFDSRSTAVGPRELYPATASSSRLVVPHVVVGADGEHPRRVARRGDAAVLRVAGGIPPEVAGSGNHGDPRLHGAPGGQRERIGEERLGHRGADRQVDHADVVLGAVRDGVVDRLDGGADRAAADAVEHLERQQAAPAARRRRRRRPESVPSPPMMPATCVPWPKSS